MRYWRHAKSASPFGSDVLLTLATNILLAAIGLATGVLAARQLGPQGRGELAAIQTWPSFFALISVLGLPEAVVYFSAKKTRDTGKYLISGLALSLIAAIPLIAIAYFLMPILLSAQPTGVVQAARFYLFFIPLNTLCGFPIQALRGKNDIFGWNILRTLPNLAWLFVLLRALTNETNRPESIAFAYLFALLLIFIPIAITVFRRIRESFQMGIGNWNRMLRFGLPSMLSGIPQVLNLRLDQMLMAAFLPSELLGLYVVSVAWAGSVRPLHGAIAAVLFPRIASANEAQEQSRAYAQGSRLGVLVSVPLAALVAFTTPVFVHLLFGAEFTAAILPAILLTFAASLEGWNQIMEEGMRGLGDPGAVLKVELGGLAASLIGLLLLLPTFNILGAALATLLADITISFLLIRRSTKTTLLPISAFLIPNFSEIKIVWERVAHIGVNTK